MHNRSPAMSTGLDDLVMLCFDATGLLDLDEKVLEANLSSMLDDLIVLSFPLV